MGNALVPGVGEGAEGRFVDVARRLGEATRMSDMSDDLNARADVRLDEALKEAGARDPREFYRDRLRELKQANPEAYAAAVAYYRDTLIPQVASGEGDPIAAWTEYGRSLAEALAPGRTVAVDGTGRADPYRAPAPRDRLILHLPEGRGGRALLVALPAELTPAQRATYDVLVAGKQKPR